MMTKREKIKTVILTLKFVLLIYCIDLMCYFLKIMSLKESEEFPIILLIVSSIYLFYNLLKIDNARQIIVCSVIALILIVFFSKAFTEGDMVLDFLKKTFNVSTTTLIVWIVMVTSLFLAEQIVFKFVDNFSTSKIRLINSEEILDNFSD